MCEGRGMKLKSVKYSQCSGKINEWNLELLTLDTLNLIVGKNASGKTKSLALINNLAKLLRGEMKPGLASGLTSGNWEASFENQDQNYKYILRIDHGVVLDEKFEVNGLVMLDRGANGIGKIYAEVLKENIDFQTPDSELALTARRDSIQHPYFEPLTEWASSVYHYAFGTALGKNIFGLLRKDGDIDIDPKNTDMVIGIYNKGDKKFKEAIIFDLKNIGYDISDIGIGAPTSIRTHDTSRDVLTGLWVQETDLKGKTEQIEISQGMFRVLSLIIQLNYLALAHKPSCILIDDIGEGLDFERSCALIKLLMSKTSESKIQLIMATNDRFVMNNVPLDVWTVLNRDGPRCKVFNIYNAKDKFEEFKFTGLNNFDFFSMDYFTSDHKK